MRETIVLPVEDFRGVTESRPSGGGKRQPRSIYPFNRILRKVVISSKGSLATPVSLPRRTSSLFESQPRFQLPTGTNPMGMWVRQVILY